MIREASDDRSKCSLKLSNVGNETQKIQEQKIRKRKSHLFFVLFIYEAIRRMLKSRAVIMQAPITVNECVAMIEKARSAQRKHTENAFVYSFLSQ